MKHFIIYLSFFILIGCTEKPVIPDPVSTMYFPPMGETWETMSLNDAGFNSANLQSLLDYVNEKHTKGFIILKNGKIVVEAYFNGHSQSSLWYWASAGKTLTATTTGIAEKEGLINLNNKVSQYLGTGWTSATLTQENLITCKHLLTMTSGLDDSTGDNVSPSNLHYKANAGSRWAYHNVYVKLQDVVANASGQAWSNYFNVKLRDKIGMEGLWITTNDLSVYYSTTRSMARFGLLALNQGTWNGQEILNNTFFASALSTSQNLNKSYGYLWWLNGKESYMLPQSQWVFSGSIIPNAPDELVAALGKNDQKIYLIPSKKIVVVRMGDAADGSNFSVSEFDNVLWSKINLVINN